MTISAWVSGLGLDAPYLGWTSLQTPLNQTTRTSTMTCPPSIVHDIPERLSLWVHTILQAAAVRPEPIGRPWLLT